MHYPLLQGPQSALDYWRVPVLSEPALLQYLHCFHWAMAWTMGHNGLFPVTDAEFLLAIAAAILGVAATATLITQAMSAISSLNLGLAGALLLS